MLELHFKTETMWHKVDTDLTDLEDLDSLGRVLRFNSWRIVDSAKPYTPIRQYFNRLSNLVIH